MDRSKHAMFEGPRSGFNQCDDIDTWSDESSSAESCSSGEEWTISITYIKPSYLDQHAALPASAEFGFPHIVNTQGTRVIIKEDAHVLDTDGECSPKLQFNERFKLSGADGVATFLYNKEANALAAFLDKMSPYFFFHCEAQETGPYEHDIVILRNHKCVTVGTFLRDTSKSPPLENTTTTSTRIYMLGGSFIEYEIEDSGIWSPRGKYKNCSHESFRHIENGLAFDLVYYSDRYTKNARLRFSTGREDVERMENWIVLAPKDTGA